MNHTPKEQLRELIRQVIREELKSREVKKDPETGVTTSHLEDPEGTRVGYMKHTPTGVVGRLGPKAAEKKVDEAEYNKDSVDKAIETSKEKIGGAEANAIHRLLKGRHGKKGAKKSIEDKAREMGQIEMFEERLRETSTYKLKTNQTEARLSPDDAKGILDKHDAHDDFHALKSDKVSALLGAAKDAKYRRRSDAPGSKARMFHQHLTRLAAKKK